MENRDAEPAMPVEIPAKVVEEDVPVVVGGRYPAETMAGAPEMSRKGAPDELLAALPKNTTAFPGFAAKSTRSAMTG